MPRSRRRKGRAFLKIAALFLASTAHDVSPGWQQLRLLYLRRHFPRKFHALDVRDVRRTHIEEYKSWRLSAGVSTVTVNKELSVLSKVLRWAVTEGLIRRSPMEAVQRLRRDHVPRIRTFTDEELARLLEAARRDPAGAYVWLAVYSGGRPRELLLLRWTDIDLVAGVVRFEHRRDHPTKTGTSRTVPIARELRAYLESLPRMLPASSYVLRGLRGHRRSVRRALRRIAQAAGLAPFGPYALRHACATLLARRKVSAPLIQRWMGHTDISTTQKYIHLANEDLRGVEEVLRLGGPSAAATTRLP